MDEWHECEKSMVGPQQGKYAEYSWPGIGYLDQAAITVNLRALGMVSQGSQASRAHALIPLYLAQGFWGELVLHKELACVILKVELELLCKAANHIFFCFSPFCSSSILPKLCIA